jgi:cellulose synthase/poly-beta-1,6-N-acetylglucosamine synthase-like glycosyltransferase
MIQLLFSHWYILFFTVLWSAALLIAAWAARVAQFFNLRMPRVIAQPLTEKFPMVAVIAPIKGVDANTRDNIAALLQQDYPHYRVLFAVESLDDPVCGVITQATRDTAGPKTEIVAAGRAIQRGQKVHNQLAAVDHTTPDDQFLAFMDADAHPAANWLHALVSMLNSHHIGATTGYRFYVPNNSHPANAIICVLNAMVGTLLGPYRRTVAWGGSMAIRRADFFAYGVHDAWQGALSDDYVLTWCVKRNARTKIHFVPQCIVASEADFNWSKAWEFAVRQYRITRVCAGRLWLTGIAGALLYLIALISAPMAAIVLAITGSAWWMVPAVAFAGLYSLSIYRGWMVLKAARRLLPAHIAAIDQAKFWFTFGMPMVHAVNAVFLAGAATGRTITWRGIRYVMHSRTSTAVLPPE